MAPPDNGNLYSSFQDLVSLDQITATTYRSTHLAFAPANGARTYGGHVYMQACYAASKTVPKGFVLHNVTGWFLLAGLPHEKFTYTVRIIRNGGYATRGVDVVQETNPEYCFTCICSFKKPEKLSPTNNNPSIDISQNLNLGHHFATALGSKHPSQHPEMPSVDAPWYWEYSAQNDGYTDPFPGLDLRKVDMDAWNAGKAYDEKRSLKFYAVRGGMPTVEEDPNMHLAAHLYASDRNSLFVISNHLDIGDNYSQIASLSHTVIFNVDGNEASEWSMTAADGTPRWFCQEAWTTGARQGRGMHHSRMWRDDGMLVATTIQDGMVRLKQEGAVGKPGFGPQAMDGQVKQTKTRRPSAEKL